MIAMVLLELRYGCDCSWTSGRKNCAAITILVRLQSCVPDAKPANIVTKHMRKGFTEHRKALKNNIGRLQPDTRSEPVRVDAPPQWIRDRINVPS